MPSSDGRDGQSYTMKLPFFQLGKFILHCICSIWVKPRSQRSCKCRWGVHQISGLPSISASPFVRALYTCGFAEKLSFAAFLRYDEISKLRCCDVTFSTESMSVRIRSSKTDQYRQGDTVLMARTGSPTCPVAMLEQYFRWRC